VATVSLPNLPKEKEFEEFVSAVYQAVGLFVERNIIEKDVEEILELDVILTNYSSPQVPALELLEVKSGKWGFPDVFKLLGWKTYLNLPVARLIVQQANKKLDLYQKKGEDLGVHIRSVSIGETGFDPHQIADSPNADPLDVSLWRFSYWLERKLLERLKKKKKTHPDKKCFQALDKYHSLVNNGLFFTPTIVDRIEALYSAFQENPRISAKTGHELIGESFDDDHSQVPQDLFHQTYYQAKQTDINISTLIEHRARLAVLKNAVDYKLYKDAGDEQKAGGKLKILGLDYEIPLLQLLPNSFQNGLNDISSDTHFYLYPSFWQWFMWFFGGFILLDYEEQEHRLLSMKTGVPMDQIPRAFEAYQRLFPLENGWFAGPTAQSNIKMLKMFPVPFMGIGANFRRLIYTEGQNFDELELSGIYTQNDLISWNNLVVEILDS